MAAEGTIADMLRLARRRVVEPRSTIRGLATVILQLTWDSQHHVV